MLHLYHTLLSLPLFQGLSKQDLEIVVESTKFGFDKRPAVVAVIKSGSPCTSLNFLLSGELEATWRSADGGYSVTEMIHAPALIEPERLFGLTQRYEGNYTAKTPCHFITIDKAETVVLTENYMIFRFNLLNLLSTQAQKMRRYFWQQPPSDLCHRIVRFFQSHCQHPAGEKHFHILMNRLAEEVGCSRLDVSHSLHSMQAAGLLQVHRGKVVIPALERLLNGQNF